MRRLSCRSKANRLSDRLQTTGKSPHGVPMMAQGIKRVELIK